MAEKAEGRERQSLIPEVDRRQWEKECLDAMNEEIEVKSLFTSRSRGTVKKDRKPTNEELLQQSKWVEEEMGPIEIFKQPLTNRGHGRCIAFYLRKEE